jgi:hypothetical protein
MNTLEPLRVGNAERVRSPTDTTNRYEASDGSEGFIDGAGI